jgi:hypothetical protein
MNRSGIFAAFWFAAISDLIRRDLLPKRAGVPAP